MKLSKSVLVVAIAALGASVAGVASARGPYARSLHQVDAIWVDSNMCSAGLSNELSEHGFQQTSSPRIADAILDVNVRQERTNLGAEARYTATLRGENGRVLFSMNGNEESLTQRELCADISDDIFDRLENRMG